MTFQLAAEGFSVALCVLSPVLLRVISAGLSSSLFCSLFALLLVAVHLSGISEQAVA